MCHDAMVVLARRTGVLFLSRLLCSTGCALLLIPGCIGSENDAGVRAQLISNLVRADRYRALVFELDAVAGSAPDTAVQTRVVAQATELVNKPDGMSIAADEEIASRGSDHAWTDDELHQLAAQTANLAVPDETVSVHVIAVDGHAEGDSGSTRALGLSWGNDTIVLFTQSIAATCSVGPVMHGTGAQLCRDSQGLIWLHEFAHLLGLVDLGLPMQRAHADADHPGHCDNPNCIMYWAFHMQAIDRLRDRFNRGETQQVTFDQPCLEDLATLRNAP